MAEYDKELQDLLGPPGQIKSGAGIAFKTPRVQDEFGGADEDLQRAATTSPYPLRITSGRRSPEENRAVGGVSNSDHLPGHALDVGIDKNKRLIQDYFKTIGFNVLDEGDHLHVSNKTPGKIYPQISTGFEKSTAGDSAPIYDKELEDLIGPPGGRAPKATTQPEVTPEPYEPRGFFSKEASAIGKELKSVPGALNMVRRGATNLAGQVLQGVAPLARYAIGGHQAVAEDLGIPLPETTGWAKTLSLNELGKKASNYLSSLAQPAISEPPTEYERKTGSDITKPLVPIDKTTTERGTRELLRKVGIDPNSTTGKTIQGALGSTGEVAGGLTTPSNIALLAAGQKPNLSRAAMGAFTPQMITGASHGAETLKEGIAEGDAKKIVGGLVETGISSLFGAGALKGAIGKEMPAPIRRDQNIQPYESGVKKINPSLTEAQAKDFSYPLPEKPGEAAGFSPVETGEHFGELRGENPYDLFNREKLAEDIASAREAEVGPAVSSEGPSIELPPDLVKARAYVSELAKASPEDVARYEANQNSRVITRLPTGEKRLVEKERVPDFDVNPREGSYEQPEGLIPRGPVLKEEGFGKSESLEPMNIEERPEPPQASTENVAPFEEVPAEYKASEKPSEELAPQQAPQMRIIGKVLRNEPITTREQEVFQKAKEYVEQQRADHEAQQRTQREINQDTGFMRPKPTEEPQQLSEYAASEPSERLNLEEPQKLYSKSNLAEAEPRQPEAQPARGEFASRVFERLKEDNPELKGELNYERMNMQKDAEKAVDLLANDKQKAYRVAMGAEDLPDQTSTAVNIAMAEKALEEGNHNLYAQLVKKRSLDQTRRGQEIVAEKGSVSDNSPSRYIKELIKTRMDRVVGFLSGVERVFKKESKAERATKIIDKEVAKVSKRISSKSMDLAEAQRLIDSLACK